MNSTAPLLNPSQAARRLGVSTKALRLYEDRGLLTPMRTAAGWRVYGPVEMSRAGEIIALRALGLSLSEVTLVLEGDASAFETALAAHEAVLESRAHQLHDTVQRVRKLRGELKHGSVSVAQVLTSLEQGNDRIDVSIELPWPWDGERFEMRDLRRLTYITGPLGSGKTRLAMLLAKKIPGAIFVGMDRPGLGTAAAKEQLVRDTQWEARVSRSAAMIIEAGGHRSDALLALLIAVETDRSSVRVIDMLEDGLDAPTQEALICVLRRRAPESKPLIFLTRSSSILDVDLVGPNEAIYLCPANHSPPILVAPYRGSPGYEALMLCLTTPAVRARTHGVVALRR